MIHWKDQGLSLALDLNWVKSTKGALRLPFLRSVQHYQNLSRLLTAACYAIIRDSIVVLDQL